MNQARRPNVVLYLLQKKNDNPIPQFDLSESGITMSEGARAKTATPLQRFLLLACIGVGVAMLLALVRFLPAPEKTRLWDSIFDTGHIPVFGLLTILFLFAGAILLGSRFLRIQYFVSGLVSLAIGIGVEYSQQFLSDRSAELLDVFNDLIGIVAFSLLFAIFDFRLREPRAGLLQRKTLCLLAIGLLAWGSVPLVRTIALYRDRQTALPTLLKFKDSWNQKFFYPDACKLENVAPPENWPESRTTDVVGKLTLYPAKYTGLVVHEPFPDWTGYQHLELDVLYEGETERRFVLRVHDDAHDNNWKDRFRRSFQTRPGFQTFRIPLTDIENGSASRKIDLKHVSGFSLYTPNLEQTKTLYLGNVRLIE